MGRIVRVVKNAPNLLHGYNIYVNAEKLRLIDRTFNSVYPSARSFADLGGVWNVNGAYAIYTLKKFPIDRGVIADTDYPDAVQERLSRYPRLDVLRGDFATSELTEQVGHVDVAYFFDVLLHQANPDWDRVLTAYANVASCFVIYNQQYIQGQETTRLTDLPLERYIALAPKGREAFYRHVYAHRTEVHPTYRKPWIDIHNIFQWGITDKDLRSHMAGLGYEEVHYGNHGRFSNLTAFENHSFIFMRDDRGVTAG
jgi:hypothetical protein